MFCFWKIGIIVDRLKPSKCLESFGAEYFLVSSFCFLLKASASLHVPLQATSWHVAGVSFNPSRRRRQHHCWVETQWWPQRSRACCPQFQNGSRWQVFYLTFRSGGCRAELSIRSNSFTFKTHCLSELLPGENLWERDPFPLRRHVLAAALSLACRSSGWDRVCVWLVSWTLLTCPEFVGAKRTRPHCSELRKSCSNSRGLFVTMFASQTNFFFQAILGQGPARCLMCVLSQKHAGFGFGRVATRW